MKGLQTFTVAPAIPEKLRFLESLSHNLWWSWNADAIELFRRINRELWKECRHNPVLFLGRLPQERMDALCNDESFIAHLERVQEAYETDVLNPPENRNATYQTNDAIAYFSAEFGIHESLPLFAGGLGVLAGDHLKAASNIGMPMVAVGLLYRFGYFRQYLNNDGWQQETYPENETYYLPLERVLDAQGHQLSVSVPIPDGVLKMIAWKTQVGRIPLFLLDTNVVENTPELRNITAHLYGGDLKTRLLQEIVLGIGGMRLLLAMGIDPQVCHMNEGHSAFISLERIAHLLQVHKLDKKAALEIIARTNVFTTHTPVAAGHDEFPVDMIRPFFEALHEIMPMTVDEVLALGRPPQATPSDPVSMTVLALHLSQYCNGVSQLHGATARRMWHHLWPGIPEDETPIASISNGVHTSSWLSPENALLFDRYLGPEWQIRPGDPAMSARIDQIPDDELWRAREMGRARLIRKCRELNVQRLQQRHASRTDIELARGALDANTLTVGFARRFATYKRAELILQDAQRLEALLSGSTPIQLIFSGKSHPHDNGGKELIKRIVHFARHSNICRRIIFLEDYDIDVARILVQGVDVWLNTPRRPLEASGTSGMKAAINGGLNVSVLDGWWDEGYTPERGWSIGAGEEYQDAVYQDAVESQALYNLLENEVIPMFYERTEDHLPSEWIAMMKASIKMAFGSFSSHRMVREYEERFYIPALKRGRKLLEHDAAEANQLAQQYSRLARLWKQLRLGKPMSAADPSGLRVGNSLTLTVTAFLGELTPEDVVIELYYGPMTTANQIATGCRRTMKMAQDLGKGQYVFDCRIECCATGRYGFTARALPAGDEWMRSLPGFITWAEEPQLERN